MPRQDGREVLAEIKADDRLKQIPVAILTTSDADGDASTCYRLHANCFVVKPLELAVFFHVLSQLERFWIRVVRRVSPEDIPKDSLVSQGPSHGGSRSDG